MQDDHEHRIRERAHQIWEREGRQDGNHDRHWQEASDEIEKQRRDDIASDMPTAGASGLATGLQPGGVIPGSGTPAGDTNGPSVTEKGGKGLSGPN